MAEVDLTAIAATSILTPAAGVGATFFDNSNKILSTKDDTGLIRTLGHNNFSAADQSLVAATRTYINGSNLKAGKGGFQLSTMFRWGFSLTKTGAGIAASTIDICFGTAGTTADTARVSFTKPAGTANADEAWFDIFAAVRGPISATGAIVGHMRMSHNQQITGHAIIPTVDVTTVSGAFSLIVADTIVGLCITTGAADVCDINLVIAEAINF